MDVTVTVVLALLFILVIELAFPGRPVDRDQRTIEARARALEAMRRRGDRP